ncbi:MAG: gamma-glutamylcyclotransferase [Deltaproteobacteria bacterium]|nr:gamma-glutamylcyclotransferase [Deltaproteobacteria bacterium]
MTDPTDDHRNRELPLFLYGSLRKGESGAHVIAADVVRRAPARTRGRLLDLKAPYPGAVFGPDEGWLAGEIVWIEPSRFRAALDHVDEYENVPFLFRRIAVTVETEGQTVEAWAFTYTHASHTIR